MTEYRPPDCEWCADLARYAVRSDGRQSEACAPHLAKSVDLLARGGRIEVVPCMVPGHVLDAIPLGEFGARRFG